MKKANLFYISGSIFLLSAITFYFTKQMLPSAMLFIAAFTNFIAGYLNSQHHVVDQVIIDEMKSNEEFMKLISDGRKNKAIKYYRKHTTSSLKDANDFVESIMKK